jgi:hypothetical protein
MASSQAGTSAKVTLSSSTDWEPWYTLLRDKATSLEVWEYVEPEAVTSQPKRPEKPKYSDIREGATDLKTLLGPEKDRDFFDMYRLAFTEWQQEDKAYDRVRAGLQDVAEYIRTTVATDWIMLIKDKPSPQDKVKALKAQLAPTDYASKMLARERYRRAQIVGRSKIDNWIQNWERALKDAQQNKIGEVHDEINPTYDFLEAVESIVPGFSSHWREKISDWKRKGKNEKIPDGFQIAQYFRDSWRAQGATELSKGSGNAGAFSAAQSTQRDKNIPSLQEKRSPSGKEKKCVCGTPRTKEHNWKTCQYVRHEILGEPYQFGFKVDESLAQTAKESLRRDWFRKLVEKIVTGVKRAETSNTIAAEESETDSANTFSYDDAAMPEYSGFNAAPEQASLIVYPKESFQLGTYPLHDSDLLDTGTTLHICNDADKFVELHQAQPSDGIFVGTTWIPITQRGTRVTYFNMGNDQPTKFTLEDVAYIPGYHTNLVSYRRLQKKGYWLNGRNNTLMWGPPTNLHTISRLLIKHGQYILRHTPISVPIKPTLQPTKSQDQTVSPVPDGSSKQPVPISTLGTIFSTPELDKYVPASGPEPTVSEGVDGLAIYSSQAKPEPPASGGVESRNTSKTVDVCGRNSICLVPHTGTKDHLPWKTLPSWRNLSDFLPSPLHHYHVIGQHTIYDGAKLPENLQLRPTPWPD